MLPSPTWPQDYAGRPPRASGKNPENEAQRLWRRSVLHTRTGSVLRGNDLEMPIQAHQVEDLLVVRGQPRDEHLLPHSTGRQQDLEDTGNAQAIDVVHASEVEQEVAGTLLGGLLSGLPERLVRGGQFPGEIEDDER